MSCSAMTRPCPSRSTRCSCTRAPSGAARNLVADARALEAAGAFAIVLEVVPREIARLVTAAVSIPTIGIGAGEHCDAQILVIHDLLGISFSQTRPRFVRQYVDLRAAMT